MRPMKKIKKHSYWTCALAMVLLIGCVAALVPPQIFANWQTVAYAPAAPGATVVDGTAAGTDETEYQVKFKYFANGMTYTPPSTYNFYKFDPTAANGKGAAITGFQDVEEGTVPTLKSDDYAVSGHTQTGGTITVGDVTYWTSENGTKCSHQADRPQSVAVPITADDYGIKIGSYTIGKDKLGVTLGAHSVTVKSGSTGTTQSPLLHKNPDGSTFSGTYQGTISQSGVTLYIYFDYVVESSVTGTGPTDGSRKDCSGSLFWKKYDTPHTVNVTYKTEVRITSKIYAYVCEANAATKELNGHMQALKYADGALTPDTAYAAYVTTVKSGAAVYPPLESALQSARLKTVADLSALLKAQIERDQLSADADTVIAANADLLAETAGFYSTMTVPIGFYLSYTGENGDPIVGGTEVLFPLEATSDIEIFVEWGTVGNDTATGTDFNAILTSAATDGLGAEYKPLAGSAGTHDLSTDKNYFGNTKVFLLSADKIVGGDSVLFCLNRGFTNVDASKTQAFANYKTGLTQTAKEKTDAANRNEKDATLGVSDSWVSLGKTDTSGTINALDYTVVLQSDLYVSGTMEIGGYTGAIGNSVMGHIIGHYVTLDLNGHNIVVENGGKLTSYGLITDSTGTGKIYVEPGGTLATQMVVFDINGGNQTVARCVSGYCPFEQYSFPYLRVDVEFLVNRQAPIRTALNRLETEPTGVGRFTVFTKFNVGEMGLSVVHLNLLGPDNALFLVSAEDTGSVWVKYKPLTGSFTDAVKNQCLDYKTQLVFDSVDLIVSEAYEVVLKMHPTKQVLVWTDLGEQTIELAFSRVIFPVSTMLDISVENDSTMRLRQELQIQPGCVMTIDPSSALILDFVNGQYFPEKGSSSVGVGLPEMTKDIAGAILVCDSYTRQNLQYIPQSVSSAIAVDKFLSNASYDSYWKVMGAGRLNVAGTLQLVGRNTETDATKKTLAGVYSLAGNVSVNQAQIVMRYAGTDLIMPDGKSSDSSSSNKAPAFKWRSANLNVANFTTTQNTVVNFRTYNLQVSPAKGVVQTVNGTKFFSVSRYWAAPMHSNGRGYLFNTDSASGYSTCVEGAYDVSTGLLTANDGNRYAVKKKNDYLLVNAAADNALVDHEVTVWKIPAADVNTVNKTIKYGGSTYVYFAGQYLKAAAAPADSPATGATVTVNTQIFYSIANNYNSGTLAYQSGKYWKLTAIANA